MSDRPPQERPDLPPEMWDRIAQMLPDRALINLNLSSTEMNWLTTYQLDRRRQAHQLLAERNNTPPVVYQMVFTQNIQNIPAHIAGLTWLLDLMERALALGPRYTQGSDWTLILNWINSIARALAALPGQPPAICGRCAQVTARAVQAWNLDRALIFVLPPG